MTHSRFSFVAVFFALSLFSAVKASPAGFQPSSAYSGWTNGPSTSAEYFPIGVWLQSPSNAANYKAIGVNLYVGLYQGPTEVQLSTLNANGMQAIATQNAVGLANAGTTIVGWMQDDEPDNAQPDGNGGYGPPVSPATVVQKYDQMKNADPTRPIYLNLGQGVAWDGWYGRGTRTNHPEDYPEYLKGSDIGSFDIYPVASNDTAVDNQLWRVPFGVDRMRQWSKPGAPVWTFIETTNISGNGKASPTQVKAEVWMALTHGATGITYFAHQIGPTFNEDALLDDTTMRDAVAAINAQVSSLAPVLNSPTITGEVTVTSSDANVPIDVMQKELGDATYLFAVGMRDGATTGSFTLDNFPSLATAEVLGENREITVHNGQFSDNFAPYGVHLYRLTAIPEPTALALVGTTLFLSCRRRR